MNPTCSDDAERQFKKYREDQEANKFVKQAGVAVELITTAVFDKNVFMNPRALWKLECDESKFSDFITPLCRTITRIAKGLKRTITLISKHFFAKW